MKKRVLARFEGAAIAIGCRWDSRPTEHPYAPVAHDPTLARLWNVNLAVRGRVLQTDVVWSGGSTDMGNVSQVVPAIHPHVAFRGRDEVPHNPAFAEAARSEAADEAVLDAATALAWTVLDAALSPEIRTELRRRCTARLAGSTRVTLQS